ncbi:hypothetical protein [Lactococcus garvieae]|uniref:hypothetical protein n=1 Tax=Lactococcus garvieae TaxID=1363 RepID=UPI0030D2A810
MTPEKKRKLRNIALLSLLGLIGGTMAFQAFNQQAINDRENTVQVNVGGRVHDYYNRDTENKDVFVENYGEQPIMVRIRLSEYLEYQRTGDMEFTPLVDGATRDNVASWTTWIPSPFNINDRLNTDASDAFDRYSRLTFGWTRPVPEGEEAPYAPWYMPTFNHDNLDLRTAAAGHARDYIAGSGATDATTDGTTHPGDGTDAYWSENDTFDNSAGIWPGDTVENEATQNLHQQRAPMTIGQWAELEDYQKIGDFWVVDHTTGWAYWASLLEPGNATSYFLDAAEMTDAIEATVFNGSYFYGIHVESSLVSPDNSGDFLESGADARLEEFLTGIRNNSMVDDGNPRATVNSKPSEFNFDVMAPGRIFTMDGVQYRYLEQQGENHLIIRNEAIRSTNFNQQGTVLENFYNSDLTDDVRELVQPVSIPATVPSISDDAAAPWGGESFRWLPAEWSQERFNGVRADRTVVNAGGTPQAFALSLADVVHLSTETGAFPNPARRVAARNTWWWLRTPGAPNFAWIVSNGSWIGQLHGHNILSHTLANGGVRPAILIRNP